MMMMMMWMFKWLFRFRFRYSELLSVLLFIISPRLFSFSCPHLIWTRITTFVLHPSFDFVFFLMLCSPLDTTTHCRLKQQQHATPRHLSTSCQLSTTEWSVARQGTVAVLSSVAACLSISSQVSMHSQLLERAHSKWLTKQSNIITILVLNDSNPSEDA